MQSVATTYIGKQVHRRMGGSIFSQITAHEPLQRLCTRSAGHYITLAGDDTFRCGTIITSLLQSAAALFTTLVALVILFQFSRPLFVSVRGVPGAGVGLGECAVPAHAAAQRD